MEADLGADLVKRAHDALLGGDDLVAKIGSARRHTAARAIRGREGRPVRGHARVDLRKPIVGATLAGLVLLRGGAAASIRCLRLFSQPRGTLGLVQQHRAARAVDLALAAPSQLMLSAEGIAFGG